MKFIFNIVLILLPCFAFPQSDDSFFQRIHSERFWISGQANLIYQAQPGVSGESGGPESLSSRYEKATSRVFTLYTGAKLSTSTELILDVEQAGGETLSRGFGLAAPANADFIGPVYGAKPYVSRLLLHKVIALSKDQEECDRGTMSTFGLLPARRIDFRLGKFGVNDFFDTNSAGSDPHLQFLNSSLVQNAAYDFPADATGYSWGAMTEFTGGSWAVRFAELLMPDTAGGNHLLINLPRGHSENAEVQFITKLILHKPTVMRVLAFSNHGPMLSYSDPRTTAPKYGIGFNLEQSISRGVTAFARLGWNNGASESFCYDEVDQTASAGVVVRGHHWQRNFDRAGVGVATNGLSPLHAAYLANGGTGMMLGDATFSYGREQVVEAFYTAHVKRGVYFSPSLQWVVNPGMNRNRGNALIAGWRTHVEF